MRRGEGVLREVSGKKEAEGQEKGEREGVGGREGLKVRRGKKGDGKEGRRGEILAEIHKSQLQHKHYTEPTSYIWSTLVITCVQNKLFSLVFCSDPLFPADSAQEE